MSNTGNKLLNADWSLVQTTILKPNCVYCSALIFTDPIYYFTTQIPI